MNTIRTSVALKITDLDGEAWISPFNPFHTSTDAKLLRKWQEHYKRLGVRTKVVDRKSNSYGDTQDLLVNVADDQRSWRRDYK